MRKLLDGKNIVVTGTARGMGKQMVETFAENGANVIACARTENPDHRLFCQDVSCKHGVEIVPVYFDLTDEVAMKTAVVSIRKLGLEIRGLVNNAGISRTSLFQMTRREDLEVMNHTDYTAHYLFTQYIVKLMLKAGGGSIVSISSSAALDCNPGLSAYADAKAALIAMTKSISRELGENNIRANAICPGVTETEMISNMHDYIMDTQKAASFLKSIAKPEDIANVAMFLLSDYSSYISGQTISVDGGITQYKKRKD